jgi:hypothetical protein
MHRHARLLQATPLKRVHKCFTPLGMILVAES